MDKIPEFLPIKDCYGYYINKNGTVISYNVGTILRELRPQMHQSGYLTVKILTNGKLKHHFLHRLVALSFLPNENSLETVNHKDANKLNNNISNLEWSSRSDNCKDFYSKFQKRQRAKCELFCNGESLGTFDSIRKAAIHINDNLEIVNVNSVLNQLRIGIKPYRGKYSIKIV